MTTLDQLRSGQLSGTRRLNLTADLTKIPPEVFDLADSLEILDLSNNHLTSLPSDLARLPHLKILFCNNNQFETLPTVLGQCPQLSMVSFKANAIHTVPAEAFVPHLRWLVLTDNQIEALPPQMGHLSRLQKLMLAGNRLRSLPESMAACQSLELIRLAANQLEALPDWLLELPRLSWLAYAGNPLTGNLLGSEFTRSQMLTQSQHAAAGQPEFIDIPWSDLAIAEVLGQGASGVISKAVWTPPSGQTQTVAVKLFKGAMTSDGLPAEEMQTCLAAGQHHNLVTVIGRVVGHPDHKQGLVFALIPPTYTNLGSPPSLDTCTRDTYPEDTVFAMPQVLTIARGIASVAAHLHARGILHGDLYAHNILIDDTGQPLLSDFGAASVYSTDSSDSPVSTDVAPAQVPHLNSKALESLEVRAFGCLLEELLDRCPTSTSDLESGSASSSNTADFKTEVSIYCQLRQLQHDCMTVHPTQRPTFDHIKSVLGALDRSDL